MDKCAYNECICSGRPQRHMMHGITAVTIHTARWFLQRWLKKCFWWLGPCLQYGVIDGVCVCVDLSEAA